jgi:hypothetical protein
MPSCVTQLVAPSERKNHPAAADVSVTSARSPRSVTPPPSPASAAVWLIHSPEAVSNASSSLSAGVPSIVTSPNPSMSRALASAIGGNR